MDCDEIVERLIDGGHKITSNIRDAIYILSDGRYVGGHDPARRKGLYLSIMDEANR
jgi:hypothetical protein